uniref:Acid phosphatase n=1 Tax=Panagrolaimus sp. JU765 TaxID=591449 RepID=A0AC34RP74_9BILA
MVVMFGGNFWIFLLHGFCFAVSTAKIIKSTFEQQEDSTSISEDKLLLVTTIWRHGQRNPVHIFEGDINKASDFPEGFGEITRYGMLQLYQLGEQLRKRYVIGLPLLSSAYLPQEIFIHSANVNRSLVSAQCVAQGLYSAGNAKHLDHLNLPVNFFPIPIHGVPVKNDFTLPFYLSCPRKEQLWKMVETNSGMMEFQNKTDFLLQKMNKNLKENLTLAIAMGIMDAIYTEHLLGLPIIPWAKDSINDFPNIIATYRAILMGYPGYFNKSEINLQKKLETLIAGQMLNEILDRFVQRANCDIHNFDDPYCDHAKGHKLFGYSGHDISLMTIFRGLGFDESNGDEQTLPGYGSCLMLELWQNGDFDESSTSSLNQHYLKILYMKDPTSGILTDLTSKLAVIVIHSYFAADANDFTQTTRVIVLNR